MNLYLFSIWTLIWIFRPFVLFNGRITEFLIRKNGCSVSGTDRSYLSEHLQNLIVDQRFPQMINDKFLVRETLPVFSSQNLSALGV